MPNPVTWIRPATQAAGINLARRIGAWRKLCGGGRNFGPWNPLYQDTDPADPQATPTQFAIEPPTEYGPFAGIEWTVAATPSNNPYGLDIAQGTKLFTQAELDSIGQFDLEDYPYEFFVTIYD